MVVQFAKWGNSLALRVPSALAREIGVTEGCAADVKIENGQLVITPRSEPEGLDLAVLVSGITDANVHDDIATGKPVGAEVW